VLLTAASACCIQLLHDANDGVYIAVGYTLHGFCELERMLLSLLTGIISSHVTDKLQTDAVHLHADNSTSSSAPEATGSAAVSSSSVSQMSVVSLESGDSKSGELSAGAKAGSYAADIELQLLTSPQQVSDHLGGELRSEASSLEVSVYHKPVDVDTQLQTSFQEVTDDPAENKTETVITRSGRLVKSKNFADFASSDTTIRESASVKKLAMKRRRGRPCKPTTDDCSNGIQHSDSVHQTSVSQQQDASVTFSAGQNMNEQESHETAASDVITEHGTIIFL